MVSMLFIGLDFFFRLAMWGSPAYLFVGEAKMMSSYCGQLYNKLPDIDRGRPVENERFFNRSGCIKLAPCLT